MAPNRDAPILRHRADLVAMLSRSLGEEVASRTVAETAKRLALHSDEIDLNQALAILEHMTSQPGIVGTAARFAKARIHLLWVAA